MFEIHKNIQQQISVFTSLLTDTRLYFIQNHQVLSKANMQILQVTSLEDKTKKKVGKWIVRRIGRKG